MSQNQQDTARLIQNFQNWEFFLAIESEYLQASRYVSVCNDNMPTFSLEFRSLLLLVCSQIEVLAKKIVSMHGANPGRSKFPALLGHVTSYYPNILADRVKLPVWLFDVLPFADTLVGGTPKWWTAYNKVKHDGTRNLTYASLQNVTEAIAALLLFTMSFSRSANGFIHTRRYEGIQGNGVVCADAIRIPIGLAPKIFLPLHGCRPDPDGATFIIFVDEPEIQINNSSPPSNFPKTSEKGRKH